MYTSHIGVNWTHSKIPFYKDTFKSDIKRIHGLFAKARENHIRVVPQSLQMDDIKRFLLSNRYSIIILVNLNVLQCHLCKEKQRKDWWNQWFSKTPTVSVPELYFSDAIDIDPVKHNQSPYSSIGSSSVPRRLSFGGLLPSSPSSSLSSYTTITAPTTLRQFTPTTPLLPKARISNSPKKTESCLSICHQYSKKSIRYVVPPTEFVGHYIVVIGYDSDTDMYFYRDPGTDSKLCAISGDGLESAHNCAETDHDLIVVRIM